MTAIEAQAKCGTASTVDQRREGGGGLQQCDHMSKSGNAEAHIFRFSINWRDAVPDL